MNPMSNFRIHQDRMQIRLPKQLKRQIELAALASNKKTSTLVRELIEDYLKTVTITVGPSTGRLSDDMVDDIATQVGKALRGQGVIND